MSSTDTMASGTGFSKPPSPRLNPKIGNPSSASPNRWAGGAYNNSPHPSSLPLPVFLNETAPSTNIPRETVADFCIDTQGVQLNNISSPGSSPRNSMNGAAIQPENLESSCIENPVSASGRPSPHKKRTVSSPSGGAPVYQPTTNNAGTISPNRRSPPRKQRQKKGKTRSVDGSCDQLPLPSQVPAQSPAPVRSPSPVQAPTPAPVPHYATPVRVLVSDVMQNHSSPMPIPRLDVLQYARYLPNAASIMMSPPSPPLYSSYSPAVRGVDLNQLSNDLRRLLNIVPSDPIAV